jgi:hypothetical protein
MLELGALIEEPQKKGDNRNELLFPKQRLSRRRNTKGHGARTPWLKSLPNHPSEG